MGICLTNIPVRLDAKTISRIDGDIKRFAPFCTGRSQLARVLIHLAYAQIEKGEVEWTVRGIQRALKIMESRLSRQRQGKPV